MAEFKCPLCKQTVSEELFERITGIWRERRAAEKKFKEQEKELLKQQKELKNKLEAERKKLKAEQKTVIEQKLAEKSKKFNIQLQKLEREKNAIKDQFDKKIANAVKSAEARVRREVNSILKEKMQETIKAQVQKATMKTQEGLLRATRTIEATRKQMSTLQQQNLKQQDRISNLETQLKNQTTPQLEGLLYEDKLIEALQKDFPHDKFVHTGKGGDILHHVILQKNEAGLIVYECKRVGHWQSAHAEQAYTAKIQRKADYAVLVTNATKKGAGGFFIEKGVIVVSPGGILALAAILREQIINIAQLKLTKSQREEAIEKTMEYLQGAEFKNSLELIIRKTVEMYEDLKKECHDHVKGWKKRYESLKSVYTNTTQVQGKTTALISGKFESKKERIEVEPFPALPDLTNA
ncbi:MAG: DUF2130 domain-containing protein [Candidatus Omnitrophota bacterium]|nr:DUF2130 domain-containing protein [Candidatus Omnitrophota bacterium]